MLRNREAEHAEIGHLRDDIERDRLIGEMPAVGVRHHLAFGKLAHLLAHRHQRFVVGPADGEVVEVAQQAHQPRAPLVVAGHQGFDRTREPRRHAGGAQTEIGRAHDLALTHRDAARDLRQEFADPDRDHQLLRFAQRAGVMGALGKGGHLTDAFDIGGEPGQPVGGALLALEQPLDGVGVDSDARTHGRRRVPQDRFRGQRRLAGKSQEFEPGIAPGCLRQHRDPPRRYFQRLSTSHVNGMQRPKMHHPQDRIEPRCVLDFHYFTAS